MHDSVTWSEESADKLSRVVWRFWLSRADLLVLDLYAIEQRATRRHAFKTVESYTRLGHDRDALKLIAEKDVPLTDAVAQRAIQEVFKNVRVVRWGDIR